MVREFAEIASQSYQNLYGEIFSYLPIFFDLILFRGIFEKEFYKFDLKYCHIFNKSISIEIAEVLCV